MDGTQRNNSTILKKLFNIQKQFKSSKESENKFGGYKFRSFESMMSKLKPLLAENELVITFNESMKEVGGDIVMECVGCITDINNGDLYNTKASVVVDKDLKGMCRAQASGSCTSYVRKYCLCGLLGVDDGSTELDSMDFTKPSMFDRIDACNTKAELNALYSGLSEEERKKWRNSFTYRKNKLNN